MLFTDYDNLPFRTMYLLMLITVTAGAEPSATSMRPSTTNTTVNVYRPMQPVSPGDHSKHGNRPSGASVAPSLTQIQSKRNNTCNLSNDTVKVDPVNSARFLKCERKTWRQNLLNATQSNTTNSSHVLIVTTEWVPYNCSETTLEGCMEELEMERNLTRGLFNSPTGDYDYEQFGGNYMNSLNAVPSIDCQTTSQPSPGSVCCASQSARLEIDLTNAQYYLQCVPTQGTQSQFGTWVRMQCPIGMVFNHAAQLCVTHFNSPVIGQNPSPNFTIDSNGVASPLVVPQLAIYCPDGERSNILCNNLYCPPSYYCYNGVCCAESSAPRFAALTAGASPSGRCPGGEQGSVICEENDTCNESSYCHHSDGGRAGFCCPQLASFEGAKCDSGEGPLEAVPHCSFRTPCPIGYACTQRRICCKHQITEMSPCRSDTVPADTACSLLTACPTQEYVCLGGRCCKFSISPLSTAIVGSTNQGPSSAHPLHSQGPSLDDVTQDKGKDTDSTATASTFPGIERTSAAVITQSDANSYEDMCMDNMFPLKVLRPCNHSVDGANSCPAGYYCDWQLSRCCLGSKSRTQSPPTAIYMVTASIPASCPDGSISLSRCFSDSNCPQLHSCINHQCCQKAMCPYGYTTLQQPPTCKTDSHCPVGCSCINDTCCKPLLCTNGLLPATTVICSSEIDCPRGYACQNSLCCSSGTKPSSSFSTRTLCPDARPPVPQVVCNNSSPCPNGFYCFKAACCQSSCPMGAKPLSDWKRCQSNGDCPVGYICQNSLCCSGTDNTESSISSYLDLQSSCPDGSTPLPTHPTCGIGDLCPDGVLCINFKCCGASILEKRLCSYGVEELSFTPCSNADSCPVGYACLDSQCCPDSDTAAFATTPICSNGAPPIASCERNKTCPDFFGCINNVCCPQISKLTCWDGTNSAVSYPCFSSGQCPAGLSCQGGLCCRIRICPDRSGPLATPVKCSNTKDCPQGYDCLEKLCCRRPPKNKRNQRCPDGSASSQACSRTASCPDDFLCITEAEKSFCCPAATTLAMLRNVSASKMCPYRRHQGDVNDSNMVFLRDNHYKFDCRFCCKSACAAIRPATCPDGRLTDAPCESDNECPRGYFCASGFCCKSKHVSNVRYQSPCPGYLSPSIQLTSCGTTTQCPNGYICPYSAGICCPQPARCPDGIQSLTTRCMYDSDCPTGFNCPPVIGFCCRATLRNCPDNTPSLITSCSSNEHCAPGYYCPLLVGACCAVRNAQMQSAPPTCPGSITLANPCGAASVCPPSYYCNIGVCCPQTTTGVLAGQCPNGQSPNGPCSNGQCGLGFTCNLPANVCCPVTAGTCPNGLIPVGPCVGGRCGVGFTCNIATNMCCPSTGNCSNGAPSKGHCNNGGCASGFACNTTTNTCCPTCPKGAHAPGLCFAGNVCSAEFTCMNGICCSTSEAEPNTECSDGEEAAGPCFPDGTCGGDFECFKNVCCPATAQVTSPSPVSAKPRTCLNDATPKGNCMDGGCQDPAYACNQTSKLCCPVVVQRSTIVAECPPGSIYGGQCLPNSTCAGQLVCLAAVNACCSAISTKTCPNRQPSFGKCSSGVCSSPGLICVGAVNLCCPSATCANGKLAVGNCVGGQCGPGFTCETASNLCCPGVAVAMCSNGQAAVGACVHGACGIGFMCETANNLCCPVTAVGTRGYCLDPPSPNSPACVKDEDCPSGFSCSLNIGACCSSYSMPTAAPSNQCGVGIAVGYCITNVCGIGYVCISFICCSVSSTAPASSGIITATCPGGTSAVGVCLNGQCGPGFTCTANNLCCPTAVSASNVCPDNTQPAGACIGGLCGSGFTCITSSNICCPGTATNAVRCLDGSSPVGPCNGGLCGVGFTCTTGNLCCPQQTNMGAALCPDGTQPVGRCADNQCGPNFVCTPEDVCCPAAAAAFPGPVPAVGGLCPAGVRSEMCLPDGLTCPTAGFVCIDGVVCCEFGTPGGRSGTGSGECDPLTNPTALGPCVSTLCPIGYVCAENGCCMPSVAREVANGEDFEREVTAPRKPYTGGHDLWAGPHGLAPGARCSGFRSSDCNGAKQGMTACVKNVCTCLPPARSNGVTCVMPPKSSISRPSVGRPYHAHSHTYPGVLSDAGMPDNATMNETEVVENNASLPLILTVTAHPSPVFTFTSLSRTVGCGKAADCDIRLQEQCINGTCISPKAPGETCASKIECITHCPNTDCRIDDKGRRVCTCPDSTYRYGRKCFTKCPKGSRRRVDRRECEDIAASNMLRDSIILHSDSDTKAESVC